MTPMEFVEDGRGIKDIGDVAFISLYENEAPSEDEEKGDVLFVSSVMYPVEIFFSFLFSSSYELGFPYVLSPYTG